MGSYAEHQNICQQIGGELLNYFPADQFGIYFRHVGVFYTKRGTPITINFAGMADIELYLRVGSNLIHIEIEVKSGEAVQSPAQKRWEKRITELGGLYIVARNADDVLQAIFKKWPELRIK